MAAEPYNLLFNCVETRLVKPVFSLFLKEDLFVLAVLEQQLFSIDFLFEISKVPREATRQLGFILESQGWLHLVLVFKQNKQRKPFIWYF